MGKILSDEEVERLSVKTSQNNILSDEEVERLSIQQQIQTEQPDTASSKVNAAIEDVSKKYPVPGSNQYLNTTETLKGVGRSFAKTGVGLFKTGGKIVEYGQKGLLFTTPSFWEASPKQQEKMFADITADNETFQKFVQEHIPDFVKASPGNLSEFIGETGGDILQMAKLIMSPAKLVGIKNGLQKAIMGGIKTPGALNVFKKAVLSLGKRGAETIPAAGLAFIRGGGGKDAVEAAADTAKFGVLFGTGLHGLGAVGKGIAGASSYVYKGIINLLNPYLEISRQKFASVSDKVKDATRKYGIDIIKSPEILEENSVKLSEQVKQMFSTFKKNAGDKYEKIMAKPFNEIINGEKLKPLIEELDEVLMPLTPVAPADIASKSSQFRGLVSRNAEKLGIKIQDMDKLTGEPIYKFFDVPLKRLHELKQALSQYVDPDATNKNQLWKIIGDASAKINKFMESNTKFYGRVKLGNSVYNKAMQELRDSGLGDNVNNLPAPRIMDAVIKAIMSETTQYPKHVYAQSIERVAKSVTDGQKVIEELVKHDAAGNWLKDMQKISAYSSLWWNFINRWSSRRFFQEGSTKDYLLGDEGIQNLKSALTVGMELPGHEKVLRDAIPGVIGLQDAGTKLSKTISPWMKLLQDKYPYYFSAAKEAAFPTKKES